MKGTEKFKEAIKAYIEQWAMTSEESLAAYTSENKKLDDCVTYILNQVKKSGVNGFDDQEIFDMAIEYYTTENIDIGGKVSGQVVINRTVELTDKEKEDARQKAKDDLAREFKAAERRKKTSTKKKPAAKKTPAKKPETKPKAEKKKEPEKKQPVQTSLF